MAAPSTAFEIAMRHHVAGQLAEAEAMYRRILSQEPAHAGALHFLGVVALQTGRPGSAVDLIRSALQIQPDLAAAWFNLGNALQTMRRDEEAAAAYRRAIELQPGLAEAHNNLGATLREQGRLDEAAAAYRRAIACNPEHVEAYSNLGGALCEQGRAGEAVAACERALQLRPDFAAAHYNLGNALRDLRRFDEAAAACRRAIELKPDYGLARINLGQLLQERGHFDEAIAIHRRGIELEPGFALLHNNLGNLLKDLGRIEEALACMRRAAELPPPSAIIHSNLLAVLQYSTGMTLPWLLDAHREYDRRHAAAFRAAWQPNRNSREPDRPLRLGLVSPHFTFHPVGHFLVRVLENLDRGQFEVVGYSDTRTADAMTDRLRATMADWREVRTLSDETLAARIREDRIDILFDLAGHTAGNRLPVFARKPAPIQITWLDYVGTTGLSAMDYILGDPREIPPEAEPWYCEKVLRMRDSYICYDPPAGAPATGPLPALTKGHVTFGSFNIPAKTSPETVRAWARILAAVPGARLLVKNRGFDDPATRARFEGILAGEGIAPARVEMRGWSPSGELLACYNEIDIALDTFPYNGGLTTCEALWMGVPVVTCPGETFAGRHGLAHLTAAGAAGTIARDPVHYVEIASGLAVDLPALAAMRAGLRAQVAASPLCDGARFAAHFMALLREVWRKWIAQAAPDGFPRL